MTWFVELLKNTAGGVLVLLFLSVLVFLLSLVVFLFRRIGRMRDRKVDYMNHFRDEGISTKILLEVYSGFSSMVGPGFPVRATDKIDKVYKPLPEDLEDEMERLMETCCDRKPTEEDWAKLSKVRTIGDLVRVLNSLQSG